jgi:hypothetical protein
MKSKFILALILTLTLSLPLFSQTGWSEPVRVSGIGWYGESAITYDSNGVLYTFYRKNTKLDIGLYSTVYFSQSFDGGTTWTAEQNITPDNNTDVYWRTKAVNDSKNNVHLLYAKGLESYSLGHKIYNGTSWSADYEIMCSSDTNMRFAIDTTDRLFATWMLSRTTYYMYCDTKADSIIWSTPKKIHPTIDYTMNDFAIDEYNNVHGIQMAHYDDGTYFSPIISKYDKDNDIWVEFKKIQEYSPGHGCAIASSHKDSLYANTSAPEDKQLQKHLVDSLWSDPIGNGTSNNDTNRIMFVDRDNVVHVFQVNKENDIHSLNHTFGKGTSWQTETIHNDPDYAIPWFDVKRKIFEDYDEYFIIYCKGSLIDGQKYSHINFQKKSIFTGIDNQSENIPESTVLYQNYPNPFNNSTDISYSISQTANVKLSVYNIKGEFVKDLINTRLSKGQHSVMFEANDLNSGIYFYRLEVDGAETENRKMLYLK